MDIKKFEMDKDYERIIDFLTKQYKKNKDMTCWLPERFDDLVYRINTLYFDERKLFKTLDYIYIFEENSDIKALILPDGESVNTCIKTGYEYLFPWMLNLAEEELKPIFTKNLNGSIDFLVVSHENLKYQAKELIKRGYKKDTVFDYDNYLYPKNISPKFKLPFEFKPTFGENLDEDMKAKACHYGFHILDDDGILTGDFREGRLSYQARKKSLYYKDSFESLIVKDDGDICGYSFCYVDTITSTAFIEPLCVRERYRGNGFSKQMIFWIIYRLNKMNIKTLYINSYDWRKKVYNKAGFKTKDYIGFWYKNI